uniref:Uncharacterized protein n=1 Tax=Latimeria chalumnae TaxID=7897 RepID=H3ASG4_LATCH
GFDDWKHAAIRVGEHEHAPKHTQTMLAWYIRRQEAGQIDTSLEIQIKLKQQYWQSVLNCVVYVLKFLAECGLAFCGEDKPVGPPCNGNYLSILDLLSQLDPVLSDYLARFGNAKSGTPSCLSSTICEELIRLIGKKLRSTIIQEVHVAKYSSISIDSILDQSHTDQLTITVRLVGQSGAPVEQFLTFIPITNSSGKNLAKIIWNYCQKNNIDFSNCISFFGILSGIYSSFSSSTCHWEILHQNLGKNKFVVKQLSGTRWSARYNAAKALKKGYGYMQN